MVKVTKTMTLDSDVAEKFQRLFPGEASSFCTEQMRMRIASSEGDLSGLRLDLLVVEEKELKAKADIINAQLVSVSEQIRKVREMTVQQEKQKLQEETERIMNLTKCNGCGKQMQEAHMKAGGEQFCKECFFNDNPKLHAALKRDKQ